MRNRAGQKSDVVGSSQQRVSNSLTVGYTTQANFKPGHTTQVRHSGTSGNQTGALVGMAKQAGRGTSHGPRKNNQLTNGHQTQNDAYTNNSNIVQIGGFKGAMNATSSHQASLNNSAILPY